MDRIKDILLQVVTFSSLALVLTVSMHLARLISLPLAIMLMQIDEIMELHVWVVPGYFGPKTFIETASKPQTIGLQR